MTEGWIKIHRQFLDHWLCTEYRPLTRREAWENMLFFANYADNEALIKGQKIICKRGQIIYSLETWAQKFNWSIGQVRQFFKLLESDKMIKVEGLKYTTRLTICNYDKYQVEQQTDNKLTTFSQQTDNILTTTSKEIKKEKKEKKEKKTYSEQAHILFSDLVILFDEKLRPDTEAKKDKWLDVCEKLLKTNNHEHIKNIVKRTRMDDFWSGNFLSLNKLIQTNKDGVKYFIVFENRFNGIQQKPKFVQ
jgi:uncharacterized protein with PIN domain